jgi:hypothetical protein
MPATRQNAASKTVDALNAAIERLNQSIAKQSESITQQAEAIKATATATQKLGMRYDGAIFGFWDETKNKQVPGLVGLVNALDWRMKIGLGGIGIFSLIGAAHSLGVPTETIGQAIAQAIFTTATHGPPTP